MNTEQIEAYRSDYKLYIRQYEGDRMAWTMASRKRADHYLGTFAGIQQPSRRRDIIENLARIPAQTEDGFITLVSDCLEIATENNTVSVKGLPSKADENRAVKSIGNDSLKRELNDLRTMLDPIKAHLARQQTTISFIENRMATIEAQLADEQLPQETLDLIQAQVDRAAILDIPTVEEWAKPTVTVEPEPELVIEEIEPPISDEQRLILNLLNTSREPIFVTGGGGVGKTFLLHKFVREYPGNIAVVCPTGVAALRAGGETIHRFLGLGAHALDEDDIHVLDPKKRAKIMGLDALLVDEISMVRADLMDAVNWSLQKNRGNKLPFGGVKVFMFGDLFQLPPVAKEKDEKKWLKAEYGTEMPFFFHSKVFRDNPPKIAELTTVFRQKDEQFIQALNAIRQGDFTDSHLALINSRVKTFTPPPGEVWITLTTTNDMAALANERMLAIIKGPEKIFQGWTDGEFDLKDAPADISLKLKVGAAVMFCRNDNEFHRYVNGTLGVVSKLSPLTVNVGGSEIFVDEAKWDKMGYQFDGAKNKLTKVTLGTFHQVPLKLAAAITIHKSQGNQFERGILNLGNGAFASGQAYVGLSRMTSLEGLVLRQPITREDIMVDSEVRHFMRGEPIARPAGQQNLFSEVPVDDAWRGLAGGDA